MFLIRRPSITVARRFLSLQQNLPFSYKEVGASRVGIAPRGYVVDRYRVRLGEGPQTYALAVEALRGWRQFDIGWVRLCWPDTPLEVGATVGVLARHYRFWSLNSARIVYVIEESGEAGRLGFGSATLPGRGARGARACARPPRRRERGVRRGGAVRVRVRYSPRARRAWGGTVPR